MQQTIDTADGAFGDHAPRGAAKFVISLSQSLPANMVTKRIAHVLRRLAVKLHGPVFDETVQGLRLRFHPTENIGDRKFLFMPQFFDPEEFRLLAEVLPPEGVFVDIGANIGVYTLQAARHLGPQGRVLAIEPGSRVRPRLLRNIALNAPAARIDVIDRAIGDKPGTLTLYAHPYNQGGNSIVRNFGQGGETVTIVPLTDLLRDVGIDRIDALKIDIEGAEDVALMPFFRDAPDSLLPELLILERSEKIWKEDLLGRVAALGYVRAGRSKMNHVFRRPRG